MTSDGTYFAVRSSHSFTAVLPPAPLDRRPAPATTLFTSTARDMTSPPEEECQFDAIPHPAIPTGTIQPRRSGLISHLNIERRDAGGAAGNRWRLLTLRESNRPF